MNPLLTTKQESFRTGTDDLYFYHNRLVKLDNGVLLFCLKGEADVTIDFKHCHLTENTTLVIFPESVVSLLQKSKDFQVHYFAYSKAMLDTASFRLEPAFIHFLRENPCYKQTHPGLLSAIHGLIAASNAIYQDRNNRFREAIAANHLQIFFLDTYDKVERFVEKGAEENCGRKEELFKKFIDMVHTHCTTQRDVAYYADQLCISTRYLSAITTQVAQESAKSIIDNFVILELKVALQSTALSLKEIADRYHFPDQSFFGRYFKKHTGMSPKEFRMRG
ncbi:MAG: AraC family transcriptional regulator [Bacteroides sp.]|nr:AraC family transcriptional regulator [Bacteroides sp.]